MITMQSRPTAEVEVTTNFDARREWEAAVAAEVAASMQAARRASQKEAPGVAEARAAQDALREQMAASTYRFVLQALPRRKYRALVSAHPPREGVEADREQQVNMDTFGDALIAASIIRVLDHEGAEVPFNPNTDWVPLADDMTDAQWTECYKAAVVLNLQVAAVPPKRVAS